MEIEAFVHGAMCVSFSGRCLLSKYLVDRDANRGACAQPCRWNYKLYEIEEEKRPDMRFPIVENELGTFIMSSKDMCMIEHIPELMKSGITSFKVEGRMKSAYYSAVCANSYRMAIDTYTKDPDSYRFDPEWKKELESVSHREYCTGYYFDAPAESAQVVSKDGYILEKAYLARVESFDPETMLATLVQQNKLSTHTYVELLTPGSVGKRFFASELYGTDMQPIESAPHPQMRYKLRLPFEAKEGDILRSST